jgi:plastocyanin
MRKQLLVLGLLAISAPASTAENAADGQILDPAVHGLKRLETLTFGSEQDNTHMQPAEYRLKVGQGYRWKIVATPGAEYAFVAPAFLRNVWIRKVEVGEVEIKAATLDELEFENGGEAEIFFVAIRPGTYEFGSRGLMERGKSGKIIVESAGG